MLARCGTLVLAFLLTFVHQAQAALTIEILQGIDRPYPIAAVSFAGEEIKTESLPKGFLDVIHHDLMLTGRFEFLSDTQLPQTKISPMEFDWSKWSEIAKTTDYALMGKIVPDGAEHMTVKFELVSLIERRALVGQKFEHIHVNALRGLAHHISDQVYKAVTGVKGDFSTKIAYVEVANPRDTKAEHRLYVADADGFAPKMLLKQSTPIAAPAWSPDGKRLAYVTYLNNRMAIYAITLNSGKRELISYHTGTNSAPAWSPNGAQMAMALSKGESERTDIYIKDLKTKQLKKLTSRGTNTGPTWSPDGKRIAYTSTQGGSPQIYEVDIKTGRQKRVTFSGVKNFNPVYTPNGRGLVMMHQASRGGAIRIAKLDLAREQVTILTHGQIDKSPSISPGGSMIIYANYDGRYGVLAETSINGMVQLSLPSPGGSVQSPAWSPHLNV